MPQIPSDPPEHAEHQEQQHDRDAQSIQRPYGQDAERVERPKTSGSSAVAVGAEAARRQESVLGLGDPAGGHTAVGARIGGST